MLSMSPNCNELETDEKIKQIQKVKYVTGIRDIKELGILQGILRRVYKYQKV
jgi:hypothetical protein